MRDRAPWLWRRQRDCRQWCNTQDWTAIHCNTHWNTSKGVSIVMQKPEYILKHTAIYCNTLQCNIIHCATGCHICDVVKRSANSDAIHCNTLQHAAIHCNALQHTAAHCNKLCNRAPYLQRRRRECRQWCQKLKYTAIRCNTLQRTATHCNALQHTATHYAIGCHYCDIVEGSVDSHQSGVSRCTYENTYMYLYIYIYMYMYILYI